MTGFRHTITVRYGECDMQGVVFNANYLAYVDDAVGNWMKAALRSESTFIGDPIDVHGVGFDCMAKRADITWHSALRFAETVDLDCSVARWGKSSFDIEVRGTVDGTDRFSCLVTYVSVVPSTQQPVPVPERVKVALDVTYPN